MSKNITIKEGATPRNFTAKKLKTNVTGGGTCLWVPEEDVQLATKSITENGTYKASDDGEYGYSQVTVNVPGGAGGSPGGAGSSIIGTDTDGNDYLIEVEQDGTLDKTKLPSSITVTTPPTKTTYTDGETIDITGIGIVAYDAEGHPMQLVNASEVSIEPTAADLSKATGEYYELNGVIGVWAVANGEAVKDYQGIKGYRTDIVPKAVFGDYGAGAMFAVYDGVGYIAPNYSGIIGYTVDASGESTAGVWGSIVQSDVFVGSQYVYIHEYVPESSSSPVGVDINDMQKIGAKQTITVSWPRPGDGKILTTTFDIEVEEATQSGGSQGTF